MARPPRLHTDDDEPYVEAAVDGTRREFRLSDRAETLLAKLGYEPGEFVPFLVVKTLVLAGGATLPETAPLDAALGLSGADGGREPTAQARYRTAEYLRAVDADASAAETLREHVEQTGLSRYVRPDEITSRADRVGDLSDIARDL
ncbi:hypothetical protein [Halosegnis sp.]|uniref:hypothetical protein n=1 Tax=Halosegnis sp. TaxID=2864959 RepID=UPI0035D4E2B0